MNPLFKATICMAVGLLAAEVRAQDPGDVGSPECRQVQLQAQAAVLAGAPYRTKGAPIKTAAKVVDPAVRSGFITPSCSGCIMTQFGRGFPIDQQQTCGPICGNAVCQRGEDTCTCQADCGSACGDTCCNGGEDTCSCSEDCGSTCGDTCCNAAEDPCNCPADCGNSCRGACCDGFIYVCYESTLEDCSASLDTYLGDGTTCESQIAACPTGACCLRGSCIDAESQGYHLSQYTCETGGGAYLGDGTTCATVTTTCRGACCDGFIYVCYESTVEDCVASLDTFLGIDTTCESQLAACPTGACCLGGSCIDAESQGYHLSQYTCETGGGEYLGDGTTCATAECPQGCCRPNGSCLDQAPSACQAAGGRPQGPGSDCFYTAGCPEACCLGDGTCQDTLDFLCDSNGGTSLGPGTECASTECPQACCHPDGTCWDQVAGACDAAGGRPQNPGSRCLFMAGCPEACCLGDGTCQDTLDFLCEGNGGIPQGPGTQCTLVPLTCGGN